MEKNEITEEQLEALYIYLSLNYDSFSDEEKKFWFELMNDLDKEFKQEVINYGNSENTSPEGMS